MLETGVASVEDIDSTCVYTAGYPTGPFRLMGFGRDQPYELHITGRRNLFMVKYRFK